MKERTFCELLQALERKKILTGQRIVEIAAKTTITMLKKFEELDQVLDFEQKQEKLKEEPPLMTSFSPSCSA